MCELCDREPHEYEPPSSDALALAALLTPDDHWNAWHIVVEDGNCDDHNVMWCANQAATDHEKEIGRRMIALSEEQRLSAIATFLGILTPERS